VLLQRHRHDAQNLREVAHAERVDPGLVSKGYIASIPAVLFS
jgi:hypothetical protein